MQEPNRVVRIKSNVNDESSFKFKNSSSDTLTYYTFLFGKPTLLDTGAEINVIQENALETIPADKKRNEVRKATRAQNANCGTVDGRGTVQILIQGHWNDFHIWPRASTDIIIGQPVIQGDVHASHRDKLMTIQHDDTDVTYTFTLVPRAEIKRRRINRVQAIHETHKLVLKRERIFQPGIAKIYTNELSGTLETMGKREFRASERLLNTRGILTANHLFRDGEEPIIYICVRRPTIIPAGTELGSLQRIQDTEEVHPLVQSLIDFGSLDNPLDNPPPCSEQQPNWRTETRSEADVITDPKYTPYNEARFNQVWNELKVSLNPYYVKMTQREKDELLRVIKKYLHVWAANLSPMQGAQHHIDTGNAVPVKQRQYKLGVAERDAVKKWVGEMRQAGLIQASNSPWCSPLLCVRKPDGTFRVCMDARKLNELTIKDAYPVHNVQDNLEKLGGSVLFSTMDLLSGFWQVELDEESREKTAVATPLGLFEHVVMPMGLCNAPQTFTRIMDGILGDLTELFIKIYMDDILIHSKRRDCRVNESVAMLHIRQLECTLGRLSKRGLSLKAKKTHLLLRKVHFLGHEISEKGLSPNSDKVKAIQEAKRPRTRKELKSWLGMVGFYRNYISNHAKLCHPFRKLDKDKISTAEFNRQWGPEQTRAFKNIKQAITSDTVMMHPDVTKPFIIHVDGSYKGLGATLNQKDDNGNVRPVWYASRAPTKTEQNYDARELECLALLWSLEKWRYLLPNKVTVITDHANLLKLKTYVKHKRRMIRWAIRISQYDINLKHRSGNKHIDADHLSRIPRGHNTDPVMTIGAIQEVEQEYEVTITLNSDTANVSVIMKREKSSEMDNTTDKLQVGAINLPNKLNQTRLIREQKHDSKCKEIVKHIKLGDKGNQRFTRLFNLNDKGILEYAAVVRLKKSDRFNRLERRKPQIVVPASMVDDVIEYYHHTPQLAHASFEQTVARIREIFYWRTMRKDVHEFISTCEPCIRGKTRHQQQPILVEKSVMNEEVFGTVFMDFTSVEADNEHGYTAILTMIDEASDFILLEPTRDQKGRTICDTIYNRLVCQMGKLPYKVVMDHGMMSDEVRNFLRDLGIACKPKKQVRIAPTAPHNPQANKVERMHSELKKYLRTICYQLKHQAHWPELLQPFAFRWNSRRREKLGGYSPFEIITYENPELSIERMLSPYDSHYQRRSKLSYHSQRVQEMFERREKMRNIQQKRLEEFQERQDQKDRIRQPIIYQSGDWVIRREKVLGSRSKGTSKSLEMKWSGPHRIIKRASTGAHVYNVRFASGKEVKVPEHLLRPISDQTRFRENNHMLTNYVNPEYVVYSIGDLVAYRPLKDVLDTREQDHAVFRLGEIIYINYEGNNEDELAEKYKIHAFGVHQENLRPNRAKRLKLPHRPLYVNAERTENYKYQYTKSEGKQADNAELTLEISKAQMLNIPPIRLTNARTIKPKDRRLIDAYFRDFNADIREYQKARAKARKRKQQLEALGRRHSTRSSKAPDRLIANAIDLRPSTLVNQGAELEHYYRNEQIGELVAQVLKSTNIYM